MLWELLIPGLQESPNLLIQSFPTTSTATPYFPYNFKMFLNRPFQEHLTGQRGPTNWPAHSPGLATVDFYWWDFDSTDTDEW